MHTSKQLSKIVLSKIYKKHKIKRKIEYLSENHTIRSKIEFSKKHIDIRKKINDYDDSILNNHWTFSFTAWGGELGIEDIKIEEGETLFDALIKNQRICGNLFIPTDIILTSQSNKVIINKAHPEECEITNIYTIFHLSSNQTKELRHKILSSYLGKL